MKEELKFLKDLQQELKTQEIDGQAAPRFWTVGDYKFVEANQENATKTTIYTHDDCESYELEEYVDMLKESGDYDEEQIDELETILDWQDDYDLEKWIRENVTENFSFVYEKKEHVIKPDTLFLTKQEAKDHIKANQHHYTKEAHTYAMTAWRAPKVEKLLNILETFDWDSIEQKVKGNV